MQLDQLPGTLKKWQIYTTLVVVFLIYIALAWQSYISINRELTDSALVRRLSIAQLAASTLSEKFERLTAIGISLATRVQFRELVAEGKWQQAGKIMSTVPQNFPYIQRVFLTDIDGTETVDIPHLPGGVGKNFAFRDWYKGVSKNWEPYISPVYIRTALPRIKLFAVAVPIKTDDGKLLGILVLQVKLEDFFTWAEGLDIGPGGFVYVTDSKGQIAHHPEYPVQGEIVDYTNVPVTQKALRGETGVEITFNPAEKEERVAAYVPAAHGWAVTAQQPVSTAFVSKNSQLTRILSGYGVFLLFCITVVWLTIHILQQRRQVEEDKKLRGELERRVAERTRQLEAANAELESFSYSVSHDLRAPLRAIDGYSAILEQDYSDKLDAEGRRLFNVIRSSAQNMSTLIDELLEFSRLGKQTLKPVEIDMDELVDESFRIITSRQIDNPPELVHHPLPVARGDLVLLRQVWSNLLSNAIKYSSGKGKPMVEVGADKTETETVYYVKDNGAGFDMEYYDKLFSVFQRLHKSSDFSGTGIGLATVQRVIHRHGGRVWAESRVNEGATFYFSLPDKAVIS